MFISVLVWRKLRAGEEGVGSSIKSEANPEK